MAPTRPPPNVKSKKEKQSAAKEDDIAAALVHRKQEGTSFHMLTLLFNVPCSTFVDRARGGLSR